MKIVSHLRQRKCNIAPSKVSRRYPFGSIPNFVESSNIEGIVEADANVYSKIEDFDERKMNVIYFYLSAIRMSLGKPTGCGVELSVTLEKRKFC